MRITICTWDTPDYADLAAVSQPGKEEYAKRHGYKFVHDQRPLVNPLGFERMAVVQELLGRNDCVLSVDTDALIMNHTLKVERLYREGRGIVISEDLFSMNDGVFAVFNTPLTHQFIWAYLALAQQGTANSQQLLMHFAFNTKKYASLFEIVDQKEINSYRQELYGRKGIDGQFEPGDWICHYPGLTKDARIPLMQEALESVIR